MVPSKNEAGGEFTCRASIEGVKRDPSLLCVQDTGSFPPGCTGHLGLCCRELLRPGTEDDNRECGSYPTAHAKQDAECRGSCCDSISGELGICEGAPTPSGSLGVLSIQYRSDLLDPVLSSVFVDGSWLLRVLLPVQPLLWQPLEVSLPPGLTKLRLEFREE
jgi:hypothetical protein